MAKQMVEGRADSSPVKPTLNYEQAKGLFEQECVFFGSCCGVQINRVAELLGDEAARYARNYRGGKAGQYSNQFWIEGYRCEYLTRDGFFQAIAYANVQMLAQMEAQE